MAELATLSIKHRSHWDDAPVSPSLAAMGEERRASYTPRTQARPKRLRMAECREVLPSQSPLLPGIHLHGSACRCDEIQSANEIADALLAQKISSLSKSLLPDNTPITTTPKPPRPHRSRHGSPRHGILSTLSRIFSPPPRPTPSALSLPFQADLCNGAADLDIDKVARYLVLSPPAEALPVDQPNHLGLTPLMAAVQSPAAADRPQAHLGMVRFLVEVCGASVEKTRVDRVTGLGESVLSMACVAGRVELVKFLVGRGAAVDARLPVAAGVGAAGRSEGGKGRTALHAAVEAGKWECVEVLVREGGANVDAAFEARGSHAWREGSATKLKGKKGIGRRSFASALHLAHASPACTRILLHGGAKVDVDDGFGRTPLHWAAEAGHFDVVRLLVGAGADLNAPAKDGLTPLGALVEFLDEKEGGHDHVEIARLLLQGEEVDAGFLSEKVITEQTD